MSLCGLLSQPNTGSIYPSGEIQIARLVDLAAERVGASIEYDAAALRGATTLRLGDGLTARQLWTLTNELLAGRGLTTLRRSEDSPVISIVKTSDAARVVSLDVDLASVPEPVPGFISVGLTLKHIGPEDFIEQIEPLRTPSVGQAAPGETPGTVRIADLTTVVRRVVSLASVIDHPNAASWMEFVPVVSLPPTEVIRLVSTIRVVGGLRAPVGRPKKAGSMKGRTAELSLRSGPLRHGPQYAS